MVFKTLLGRKGADTSTPKAIDGFPSKSALPMASNPTKELTFGTNLVVKTFYEKKEGRSNSNWVETPPKQLNKKVSNAFDRVAIKMYKVEDPDLPTISGRTPLKIQKIEIQSPIIVEALKDILEDEGTWLEVHEAATFQAPFNALYFSYEKIFDLYNQASSGSILKEHLYLLTQIMIEVFSGMMTQIKHLQESKLITFKLAWAYFPKGSILYSDAGDCGCFFRVLNTRYTIQGLIICCQEIRFDGMAFEWKSIELTHPAFSGNLPITDLLYYPLMFHANASALKAKSIERGKKVLDYQGLVYCEYFGVTNGQLKKHNVRLI